MPHTEPVTILRNPARESTLPATGITIYGCDDDEAALFRELAPRLGITLTITDAPLSEANADLAVGHRSISVSHKTPVTNATLSALARVGVEYLSTRSVGADHIDADFAANAGITVGNVAYSPDSVADYTLMLMLMLVRNGQSIIRRADDRDYRLSETRGRELRDLTVGVVGTGRIGTAVIERLRGFGCRILAHDSRSKTAAEHVPLDELLQRSDVVTLHAPLTAATQHLLNAERIGRMKHGASIVNTSRGSLVDTRALLRALELGRIGGAALDVVEGEDGQFYQDLRETPPQADLLARLQAFPNVIISPHTAFHTDHALRDTVENSLLNCLRFEGREQHG